MSEPNLAASPKGESDAPKDEKLKSIVEPHHAEEVEPESVSTTSDDEGEFGGPKGLEPTRYGDWEKGGRCIDF